MPRKDSITGCNVMTFPEFIQGEADREGKEPHEIMDEISQIIEDDNEKMRQEYRTNALKYLQDEAKMILESWTDESKYNGQTEQYDRWDTEKQDYITITHTHDAGPRPPQPTKVIEVVDVESSQNFRNSKAKIVAKCEADDGKTYIFTLSHWASSGSRMDPPDQDSELTWELN